MKTTLLNIVTETACLSKRQLEEYTSSKISAEERYTVQMHLVSCPYCSIAVEGIDGKQSRITALKALDASFLHQTPNSRNAAGNSSKNITRNKKKSNYTLQLSAVAASLLLTMGVVWFLENNKQQAKPTPAEILKTTTVNSRSIYAQPVKYEGSGETNIVR